MEEWERQEKYEIPERFLTIKKAIENASASLGIRDLIPVVESYLSVVSGPVSDYPHLSKHFLLRISLHSLYQFTPVTDQNLRGRQSGPCAYCRYPLVC
jgi:hypothetical protein